MSDFILKKASILCYRIYDIADEIDLERMRQVVKEDARRARLTREGSQYLQLPNPPLALELGRRSLRLLGGEVQVEARVRFFDHGAASLILSVPVAPGLSLSELTPLADELYDSPAVETLCLEILQALRQQAQSALRGAHLWEQNESYTVIFVEEMEGHPTAQEVLRSVELPKLLLGEANPKHLSAGEWHDVIQANFSYWDDDLVIIDWNSAFVYEPSGSRDIPDILEICNAQLLELRYYDSVLDGQTARIYAALEEQPGGLKAIFASPYRDLVRRLQVTLLEMNEFIDRLENSLKIIGDIYLAKVYESSVVQLRIRAWQATITRKQQALHDVYQLLKGEVDTARSLTLETIIVVLIVVELFIALGPLLRH